MSRGGEPVLLQALTTLLVRAGAVDAQACPMLLLLCLNTSITPSLTTFAPRACPAAYKAEAKDKSKKRGEAGKKRKAVGAAGGWSVLAVSLSCWRRCSSARQPALPRQQCCCGASTVCSRAERKPYAPATAMLLQMRSQLQVARQQRQGSSSKSSSKSS